MTKRRIRGLLAVVAVIVVAGCSSSGDSGSSSTSTVPAAAVSEDRWPAPPDPMARAVAAGLVPDTRETLMHHVHTHLDIFVDGVPQTVPAGIGIDINDPAVHHSQSLLGQDSYGGIDVPCEKPCISPLHTHDTSGVLHTESPVDVDNTLGQFFVEWGVRFDGQCIGEFCIPDQPIVVYVDGQIVPTDVTLSQIALLDRRQIAIVIGDPPARIPKTFPTG